MVSEEQLIRWQKHLVSAGLPIDSLGQLPKEVLSGVQGFEEFLEVLVRAGKLTQWQAEQLRKGRSSFLLGRYRLLREIGRGGMGQVYLAEHLTMERRVAIKVVSASLPEKAIDLFLNEVRAIAALDHPNIVHAFNVDRQEGQFYLVMEYVDGQTLDRIVEEVGSLPWPKAADIVRQAALGLGYAHGQGIIHCDLKPANLIVNLEGAAKLLDLGLARLPGSRRNASPQAGPTTDDVIGSVDYMAPELAANPAHVDYRVDIYSLGCVLFFCLTGRPPFAAGTLAERILKHQVSPPPDLQAIRPDIPRSLGEIFRRAVAKSPSERFSSAAEMARALEQCQRDGAGSSGLVRARPLEERPRKQEQRTAVAREAAAESGSSQIRSKKQKTEEQHEHLAGDRPETLRVGSGSGIAEEHSSLQNPQSLAVEDRIEKATGLGGRLIQFRQLAARLAEKVRSLVRARPRFAAAVIAGAAVIVIGLVIVGLSLARSSGRDGRRMGAGEPGREAMKPKHAEEFQPSPRPEDDPEAFRKGVEEWMKSQLEKAKEKSP